MLTKPALVSRLLIAVLLAAPLTGAAARQVPGPPAAATAAAVPTGPLSREKASSLVPATVFFAGKVAPVQARNTSGVKLPHGLLLAGLVDTSGYSTGVQERYQAYLIVETPVEFGERTLPPGAYGCGIVGSQFLVMDVGDHELFRVPAERDAAMKRPVPLQATGDAAAGKYRLYFGRSYVAFAPAGGEAAQ